MRRRELLKVAALSAFGGGLHTACIRRGAVVLSDSPRRFARVNVAPDRIIRTVVGLRPFRPSGFVVRSETIGQKILVHNYGHGGGGMTLSWGTSHLAVEQALKTRQTRYAVLGCGGVGLATARLLQRRGVEVTIYAKELPPNTTSNIAGAQWAPAESFDPDHSTPAFLDQFARAARLSHRYFQDLAGDYYGVRWIENYYVSDSMPSTRVAQGGGQGIQDLFPAGHELSVRENPFGTPYARRFVTMLIEPPVYLNAMLRDFLLAGGKLVVREFPDLETILALPEPIVMNCTGLGAKALFHDEELMPIKGQLTVLLPQPEVDYITLTDDLYMFPRRDGILLGGTHERGVWSLDVNTEAMGRILDGHRRFFSRMR